MTTVKTEAAFTLPIVGRLRELAEHNRQHFPTTREEGFIALGDEAADTIADLYEALDKCRAIIKFHVKPERCVSVGDDVISAREAFEEAVAALAKGRGDA